MGGGLLKRSERISKRMFVIFSTMVRPENVIILEWVCFSILTLGRTAGGDRSVFFRVLSVFLSHFCLGPGLLCVVREVVRGQEKTRDERRSNRMLLNVFVLCVGG